MAYSIALPFSEGEERMHRLLRVPTHDNPTSAMLTPGAAYMLQDAPLLAIGTVDNQGRPWTGIWGGEAGFSSPLGANIIGMQTPVDAEHDPVVQALVGGRATGEVVQDFTKGRLVAGLTIDLMARRRVKLAGRMVAGALTKIDEADSDSRSAKGVHSSSPQHEIQLAVLIQQSLGNCPKYLNRKAITPAKTAPTLVSDSPKLPPEALELLSRADTFFISSSNSDIDMDTNIRGGPPGFVRVFSNEDSGAELVYPEYSGNRLYQTLGNLQSTPLAGLVFPDFETGNVLYLTGSTEILIGTDAASVIPRSNLAVKIKIQEARFVSQGLPFRGKAGEPSPYLPNLRLLAKEGNLASNIPKNAKATARLLKKTVVTPTIARYRFSLNRPVPYAAGQWVAMDFSEELDIGYSHMRDDDPRSLNDDYIRTFTVSNPPKDKNALQTEFEITVRRNGPVTDFLLQHNGRIPLEVPIKGFGGHFKIDFPSDSETVPFVAGGVGITPLLAQLPLLPQDRMRFFWTIPTKDIAFVVETLAANPKLATNTIVFFTGLKNTPNAQMDNKQALQTLQGLGVKVEMRRIQKQDLQSTSAKRWYVCASQALKPSLLEWLSGYQVEHEDFNY